MFVAHVWGMRSMNFQENTSNGNRDTAEKADYPPSMVPLIIDPSQTNLHGGRACE